MYCIILEGVLYFFIKVGIPYVRCFASTSSKNVLVMELLGLSISSILIKLKKLSLKTVCLMAIQIVNSGDLTGHLNT